MSLEPEITEQIAKAVSRVKPEHQELAALEFLLELIPNDGEFIQKFFQIKDKQSNIVPFTFNAAQRHLENIVKHLEADEKRVAPIVLKYRQGGVSTWAQAHLLMKILRRRNSSSLVIADSIDNAEWLFNIGKRMFESLPFRPKTKYDSAGRIVFNSPQGSDYTIETARNLRAGRSKTINSIHCSEIAFWEHPDVIMAGLSQAIADSLETWIIFESTANGMGGYFYEKWQMATKGESDFVPIFLPWWMGEDYVRAEDTPEYRDLNEGNFDSDEEVLIDRYKVDFGHLAWRRWAIANKCDDKLDLFHQEYPSTAEEAFLVSGRSVFPISTIEAMLQAAPEPVFDGEIEFMKAS